MRGGRRKQLWRNATSHRRRRGESKWRHISVSNSQKPVKFVEGLPTSEML